MYRIKQRVTLEQACAVFLGNKDIAKCVRGEYTSKDYFWQKNFKIKTHGKILTVLLMNGIFVRDDEDVVYNFVMKYKGRIGLDRYKVHGCVYKKIAKYGVTPGYLYQFLSDIFNRQLKYYGSEPNECQRFIFDVLNEEPRPHFTMACSYLNEVLNMYRELINELVVVDIKSALTENEIAEIVKTKDVYRYVLTMEDMLTVSAVIKVCSSTKKVQAIYNDTLLYINQPIFKQTFGDETIENVANKVNRTLSLLGIEV